MHGDRANARLIADLSNATPSVALSQRRMPGHWQVIDYEIEGLQGRLLSAGPETDAPPVQILLNARGWHALSIGFWAPRWGAPYEVRLRLSRDSHFVHWAPEEAENLQILERFWKYAELQEGDTLQIAPQSHGEAHAAAVAFVRLAPLREAEIAAVREERAGRENRRLIAMNDAFSDFYERRPESAAEIEEWIEPYRHTDVGKLFWNVGAGGDVVTYDSRHGKVIGQDTVDFPRRGDRYLAESMRILFGQGIDPLKIARDAAVGMGIEFHVSQRMEAFACCPPFEEFFTGWTYVRHPEWHCVDRDGTPVARLSYAQEGVRRLVLDLFQEVAAYGIDGINPVFNRGAPFLLYEAPLVEGFQAAHGEDPRQLDERDERWLRYRARIMTDFMRQLRREMDQAGPTPAGKRLQISAHVLNNEENNLFYGLDLKPWVDEGLVDALIAYPWRGQSSEILDLDYFARLCHGSRVAWYAELMPRRMEPAAYLDWAKRIYTAGADGLCLWDTNGRDPLWREWAIVRRLGHREALAQIDPSDTGAVDHPLLTVGGYRVDRYPPHWAY